MGEKRKLTPIPGVRLKFRTPEPGEWVTATIWIDDEPKLEIARLRLDCLERPGSPIYQAWVDATMAVFHDMLSRITGIEGITGKRKKPKYKGEG